MVGIVTAFHVNNYGSKLQAYAVQQKIAKLGYQSEIINYNPKGNISFWGTMKKFTSIDKYHSKIKEISNDIVLKRNKVYDQIVRRNASITSLDSIYSLSINLTQYDTLCRESEKYDYLVFGSDQIWRPDVIRDGFHNGLFNHTATKIAFSPSIGVSKINGELIPYYREFLSEFSALSCREKSGADLIGDIIGRNITLTLDPTLTLNKEDWDLFVNNSEIYIPDNYIFCYFLGSNPEHREAVKKLKRLTGCKVIGLPHFKKYNKCDVDYIDYPLFEVSPADFVNLISNSTYVCTDSFHGTVFSTLYERPFFCFLRYTENDSQSTNSRMQNLLQMLGMEKRLIRSPDYIEEVAKQEISWSAIEESLNSNRKVTDDYLLHAFRLDNL